MGAMQYRPPFEGKALTWAKNIFSGIINFINLLSMRFILIFHLAGFVNQGKCHYSEINTFAEQGSHFSNFSQDKTVWSQEM